MKVYEAEPTKFVTLTVNNNLYSSPREAYDQTRRAVATLTRTIRKNVGEWEYLRILEITKQGYPHYHMLVRGGYVDQNWLASEWDRLTGARIVDIRRIKNSTHATRYVMKYLYKQKAIPWTTRRVCWTRGFFPPASNDKPPSLLLEHVRCEGHWPPSFFAIYHEGRRLERIGPDMWALVQEGD